jgi:hypothetical protein
LVFSKPLQLVFPNSLSFLVLSLSFFFSPNESRISTRVFSGYKSQKITFSFDGPLVTLSLAMCVAGVDPISLEA